MEHENMYLYRKEDNTNNENIGLRWTFAVDKYALAMVGPYTLSYRISLSAQADNKPEIRHETGHLQSLIEFKREKEVT